MHEPHLNGLVRITLDHSIFDDVINDVVYYSIYKYNILLFSDWSGVAGILYGMYSFLAQVNEI